jgi:hypothetical protein
MKPPSIKRYCQHCGERFLARRKNAEYCSPNCRWKAWRERQIASKPKGNRAVKAWYTRNQTVNLRECPVCKCSFFATNNQATKKYCNRACCQKAYRQRFETKRRADVARRVIRRLEAMGCELYFGDPVAR